MFKRIEMMMTMIVFSEEEENASECNNYKGMPIFNLEMLNWSAAMISSGLT